MNITTTYEPTVAEIAGALKRNMRKGTRQSWLLASLFMLLGVVLAGFGQLVVGIIAILVGGFFALMVRMQPTAIARTSARLCNPTTLHLGDDRFTYTLPGEQGNGLWPLTKVLVGPDCWTLSVADKISVVVPKRALEPADRATFDAFLAGHDRKLIKTI
jgi:hypothetical protein